MIISFGMDVLPGGVGVNPRLRLSPLRIRSMIDETRAFQARRKRWIALGRDPFAPFRWDKCARRGRRGPRRPGAAGSGGFPAPRLGDDGGIDAEHRVAAHGAGAEARREDA